MDYRIEELITTIEENIATSLTIQDLAESVNLSVSYLQHLFKEETNQNITQFIKELRLERSRKLLETTHLRVKEIRVEIGCPDDSHFLRDFKSMFGVTPSQYRLNFRKKQKSPVNNSICQKKKLDSAQTYE